MISLFTLTFLRLVMLVYSDTRIRLTGHNTTFAGRVEVFSHGFWGRVSYSWRPWRKKEAAVVCRQLGFPGVITALTYSAFGEGSGSVMMSGVECVGTEKTLQQCQYKDWVNSEAYTGTEVGVVCKTHDFQPDLDNIPIRLQGSSVPNAGRIELLYSGVWGVIGTNNWDMNDAMVVCRQLGYQAGAEVVLTSKLYGPFFGPVWLTNLQCTGSESNVMNCARDEIANKTEQLSSRSYFARVICKDGSMLRDLPIRLQGSSIPNAGRIELLYAGVWGAISRSNWDISDAMVVCRQLGYQAGAEAALSNSVYGTFSGPVWLTNLQCTGSENNVMDCVRDSIGNKTEQQSSSYFASVICKDGSMPNGMTVRLGGSHLANVSRVEVHYAGKWGSIYPWGWNWNKMDAMTVICRQLGYATALLAGYENACSDIQSWFTNFRCYGNETSLDQCGRDFHTSSSTGCMNVVCTNETDDSGYEVRLQGSPVPYAGRVEVRIKGVWGSIASLWFYYLFYPDGMRRNARVICRQLGFPEFILPSFRSEFGTGSGPQWFYLHQAQCSGSETNILNCSFFTALPELRRDSAGDLGIVCEPDVSQVNNFQVRLVGSNVSYAGTIEVLHYQLWGGILGYNMDIRVGHVICRQLGYSGAEQISQRAEFWPLKGPLWIYSITCNGNETNISQCAFATFSDRGHHYFYGPRDAGAVICTETRVGVSRDFRVRLAGAPISNAGRVEIFYTGTWGTILGSSWDINDAHVVCRQLGYPGAISSGRSTQFGFGNGRIWFQSVRCHGNESNFGECSKSIAGYSGHYTLATALCKLKYQTAFFQNCSDVKCANNGACINSAAGPVCNCTDGFSGLYCDSASFDPCKCSPCKYGGQCYSDSSSYLCICPKGYTGKYCEERILAVVDPCQSRPCTNNTSCYHNNTNYFCVPNGEESSSRIDATPPPAFSTSLSIVIAISASVIIALVAALVCLIWKIRRLTKDHANQANDPSTVFSNKAFRTDSLNELDERRSISHREVDLGLGSADSGGEMTMDSRPVYEVCSRPLPPIPPQQKARDQMPGDAERPANGNNDVTGTEQFAVHYVGLSVRNEGSAQTSIPEPNTYMPLSSGRPQPGVYSGLNTSRAKAKRSKRPKNNGQDRRERKELYVNVQK